MILGGGDISDFSFSKAWGVNPAAASGTVIIDTSGGGSTSFSLAVGDYVTYSFGSVASFTGVVSEVGTVTEWARGLVQSFQVVDNRVRLSWQAVFAAWNIEDDYYSKSMARPVSPSTGSDSSDSGDDSVDITGTDSETLPAVLAPPIAAAPAAQWAMRRNGADGSLIFAAAVIHISVVLDLQGWFMSPVLMEWREGSAQRHWLL